MATEKDILIAAKNDEFIIKTRQMVRKQGRVIDELLDEVYDCKRNSMLALVFAAICLAFSCFVAFTFIF